MTISNQVTLGRTVLSIGRLAVRAEHLRHIFLNQQGFLPKLKKKRLSVGLKAFITGTTIRGYYSVGAVKDA